MCIFYFFSKLSSYRIYGRKWDRAKNLRSALEIVRLSSDDIETCEDLTHASLTCEGGCTVLVDDIKNEFQTCEKYCRAHGRKCRGAWDEDKNTCSPKETFDCNFEFRSTSDALCECSKKKKTRYNSENGGGGNFVKTMNGADSSSNNVGSDGSNFYNDIMSHTGGDREYANARPECPSRKVSQIGHIQYPPKGRNYDEISMIAVSRQKFKGETIIWIANDKDESYVHASTLESGENICSIKLPNKKSNDIESMSIGPCSTDRTTVCLYVANIGNNLAQSCKGGSCNNGRRWRSIFKFEEPNIKTCSGEVEASIAILPIRYNDIASPSDRADAESFFVDTTGDQNNGNPGDLYIVTKWNDDESLTRLFKYPVEKHQDQKYGKTSRVYSVQPTESPILMKQTWTDADMSTDGSLLAIRTGKKVYFFTRNSFESVSEALKKDPCFEYETPKSKNYGQFEAVSFLPNKKAFVEISECKKEDYGNCNPHAYVIEYE